MVAVAFWYVEVENLFRGPLGHSQGSVHSELIMAGLEEECSYENQSKVFFVFLTPRPRRRVLVTWSTDVFRSDSYSM
jgi:hypothetical protein